MRPDTAEQKAALQEMWPQISAYCEAHGLDRGRLMTGNAGIPVDGDALAAAAGAAWLTRDELAAQADISLDLVTKIINGRRSPTPAVLARLARALNVRPAALFRASDGHGGYGG